MTCTYCCREALVVHEIGRCGFTACAEHANRTPYCPGCGAAWMEVSKV